MQLVTCIIEELKIRNEYLDGSMVTSIYFGGGTPSLLTPVEIEGILSAINENYNLGESLEITLETNPDDVSREYLINLNQLGINRLSIGIQSFNPPVLSWMNRAHTAQQALNCVELSRNAGFDNISIDLIYAIPLPEYDLESDLEIALDLQPQHISAYNLTIEPLTVFGTQLKKGQLKEVSEETAADSFTRVISRLRSRGFLHYEISNFALPGKESRHNLGYWNGQPYLGIGPSAHSFDGQNRQFNVASNAKYIKSVQTGHIPSESETLTAEQRINEMIMLGLRTHKGIDLQLSCNNFIWELPKHSPDQLKNLLDNQYAFIQKNRLILTDKGKLIADRIAEDLFIEIT